MSKRRWTLGRTRRVAGVAGVLLGTLGPAPAAHAASVYAGAGGTLARFETVARDSYATSTISAPVPGDFVLTPDGGTAYAAGGDGVVPIAPTLGTTGPAIAAKTSAQSRLAVSPDGRALLVTSPADGIVTPVDLTAPAPVAGSAFAVPGAAAVAFTPDGRTAVVTGGAATLTPIDLTTHVVGTPIALASPGTAVSVTTDGASAVVAGGSATAGTVQIVDLASGVAGPPIALGTEAATDLTVSSDGRTAAVVDAESAVWVVDLAGRQAKKVVTGGYDRYSVTGLAMTADNLLLVGSVACSPRFCDRGTAAYDFAGHQVPGGAAVAGRLRPAPEPTAAFAGTFAYPGELQTFDAGTSSNTGGSVTGYLWDFGDGTPPVASTTPTVSHTFAAVGTYAVKLTTTNAGGCAAKVLYTGQSALCSGRPTSTITRVVTVAARYVPPPIPAPTVFTSITDGVTATRAVLNGTVNNPDHWLWSFQYGSTTRYGQQTIPHDNFTYRGPLPVTSTLTHLRPHHTYHYRLVVTKADGTVLAAGADATFTTATSGTLRLRSTTVRVVHRRARVLLRCAGSRACRGRLAVSARLRSRADRLVTVSCGRHMLSVAAAHAAAVPVPVGPRCVALLRSHPRLAGQVRSRLTSGQADLTRAVRLTGSAAR